MDHSTMFIGWNLKSKNEAKEAYCRIKWYGLRRGFVWRPSFHCFDGLRCNRLQWTFIWHRFFDFFNRLLSGFYSAFSWLSSFDFFGRLRCSRFCWAFSWLCSFDFFHGLFRYRFHWLCLGRNKYVSEISIRWAGWYQPCFRLLTRIHFYLSLYKPMILTPPVKRIINLCKGAGADLEYGFDHLRLTGGDTSEKRIGGKCVRSSKTYFSNFSPE